MNDKKLMSYEEQLLKSAAQQVSPSPSFTNDLEKKLMNAHKPTKSGLFSVKKIAFTVGWTVAIAALIVTFIWVIRSIAPQPQPQPAAGDTPFPNVETAVPESPTPESAIPEGETYKLNGQTLYLNTPLPETPAELKIYLTRNEVRATVDDAKALAERFGMSGEIYQVGGQNGNAPEYLVVDGNQQLSVRSDQYFTYFPNYAGNALAGVFSAPSNAEALIDEFMQAHGFNFEYRIEQSQLFGAHIALPLTPDGFALHHEHFKFSGMMFYFNQDRIQFVDVSLLKYDETATVGIISAEDAFQKLLDPVEGNGAGVLMGMTSGGGTETTSWRRVFPLNQTITYFGYMDSTGKSITGGAPLITLDGYTVTGNVEGVTENMQNVFVEAIGQLHDVDGLKTFEFQSWKIYDGYDEGYQGTIQREGEQVVINTDEGKKLLLPNMPSDVPLPLENAYIMGVTQGDTFEWKSFDTRMAQGGGGGGGGGGSGFYKLNLTGTPVPLPTPAPQDNSTPQLPTRVDGLRGILGVSIHKKADGSQVSEYNIFGANQNEQYYSSLLTGDNLQGLDKYNSLPVTIWGAVNPENGAIQVERYEIPFPDLQFQIVKGRQEIKEVEGQSVTVVTLEDGASYAQLMPDGSPDSSFLGIQGDLVQQEVLIIPDETFGGMPALRIYAGSISDKGTPELTLSAHEPYIYEDSENVEPENYTPPTLSIEKVELVYYIPDPRYITSELVMDQRYLQPVWRFYGHYSNGDEFEYLIQALKEEFLLPELAPYTQPG